MQFNYGLSRWNLSPNLSSRISSFWKGASTCLPALRGCIVHCINACEKTLLKDRWFNGVAPMNLWPEEFRNSSSPNDTVRELSYLLEDVPFSANPDSGRLRDRVRDSREECDNIKCWKLTGNGIFSVKSFYNFLIDGGLGVRWWGSSGAVSVQRKSISLIG